MKNPDRWPVWPLLPLLKGKDEMGVLLQSEGAYVVVQANLYMMPKSLDLAPQIKYDSDLPPIVVPHLMLVQKT